MSSLSNLSKIYIKNLAEEIRNLCKASCPMTDVDSFLKILGADIISPKPGYSDGYVVKHRDNTFSLCIKDTKNLKNKNYLSQILLGFSLLNLGYMIDLSSWNKLKTDTPLYMFSAKDVEEAKYFARCVLLPEENFVKWLSNSSTHPLLNDVTFQKTSDHFMVPASVVRDRLNDLFEEGVFNGNDFTEK